MIFRPYLSSMASSTRAFVALAVVAASSCAAAAPLPNILMVLVDDWGWANFNLHNPDNPEVVTPNLNALAQGGILLDRHYVFASTRTTHARLPA